MCGHGPSSCPGMHPCHPCHLVTYFCHRAMASGFSYLCCDRSSCCLSFFGTYDCHFLATDFSDLATASCFSYVCYSSCPGVHDCHLSVTDFSHVATANDFSYPPLASGKVRYDCHVLATDLPDRAAVNGCLPLLFAFRGQPFACWMCCYVFLGTGFVLVCHPHSGVCGHLTYWVEHTASR